MKKRKRAGRALVEGLAAGAIGAAVQSLFERVFARQERLGTVVHFSFGAGCGGIYGLVRWAAPRAGGAAAAGGLALGGLVGDHLLLPAVRLAAWPRLRPLRAHAHGLAARALYGAGTALAMAVGERAAWVPIVAGFAIAPRGARRASVEVVEVVEAQALVPRELVEAPRHLARALARRARDLSR
jgi:hypothetical protein